MVSTGESLPLKPRYDLPKQRDGQEAYIIDVRDKNGNEFERLIPPFDIDIYGENSAEALRNIVFTLFPDAVDYTFHRLDQKQYADVRKLRAQKQSDETRMALSAFVMDSTLLLSELHEPKD